MTKVPTPRSPSSIAFGVVLARLRAKKHLTQDGLSDLCGMDRTAISLLERGMRSPRLNTTMQLCAALGISFRELARLIEKEMESPDV